MSDNLPEVGVKLTVEGEKEYKDAVSQINRQGAILTSEQRKLAAQFDRTADSQEALTAKSENLKKQIELQHQKIETIQKALKNACDVYGENSKAADNWRIKLNNAERDLATLSNKLEDAEDDLRKLTSEAEDAGDEMNSAGSKVKKASKNIKDAGDNAEDSKSKWSELGSTIKKAFAFNAAISLAKDLLSTVNSLVESSMELNSDLSKFEQNVKDNNNSLSSMKTHLRDLTSLTGETDSSIEALSNLMATGFNDSQITQALDSLSGAVIKFPDTLKIESLSDSLQETIATGKGAGQFAELIKRSGYDLDKFNERLAKGKTQADRQRIALEWLSESGLAEVSAEYSKANKNMLEYKKAAYDSAAASAEMAEKLAPVSTLVEKLKTKAIKAFSSEIGNVATKVESTIQKISKYTSKFKKQSTSTLSSLKKAFGNIFLFIEDTFKGLEPITEGFFNVLEWGAGVLEDVTEYFAPLVTETDRLKDKLSQASDEWESYKNSAENALQQTATECNTLKTLQDRLSALVDENGNLTGSETELKKVIQKLNDEGFSVEYDAVKRQIKQYDSLNDSIEKVIKTKLYESKVARMQDLANQAEQDIYVKTETYNKALATQESLLLAIEEKYGSLENLQSFKSDNLLGALQDYKEYMTAIDNVTESYNQLLEAQGAIDTYENVLLLGTEGSVDTAIEEMDKYFAKVQISTTSANGLLSSSYDEIISYLEETNKGFAANIESGQKNLAQNQIALIEATLTEIKARGGEIPQSLVDSINDNLSKFNDMGGAVPEWLAHGITSNMFMAEEAVQDVVDSAANTDVSKFVTMGKAIPNGLAKGIKLAASNAISEAQALMTKINKKMAQTGEINSPSKVTQRYGKFYGEGLSLGLRKSIKDVQYDSERLALAASAPIGTASTSSFNVYNTNHFNTVDARDGAALIRQINRSLGSLYRKR